MVLRRALSNPNTPLAILFRTDKDVLTKEVSPASPQVRRPKRTYRPNRKLSTAELAQLVELYDLGMSTYKLARKYGTDRHTIGGCPGSRGIW